jgi:hypothetical protein
MPSEAKGDAGCNLQNHCSRRSLPSNFDAPDDLNISRGATTPIYGLHLRH